MLILTAFVAGLCARTASAAPPTLDLSGISLPSFDFSTLDPATFNFKDGKEVIKAGDIPGLKKDLVIALAPTVTDDEDGFRNAALGAMSATVPLILKQLKVPTNKIGPTAKEVSDSFADAAIDAIAGSTETSLARRGLIRDAFRDAWNWFKGAVKDLSKDVWAEISETGEDILEEIKDKGLDVACGAWAPIALSSFLLAEKTFREKNDHITPVGLSEHQKYFVAALHGNLYKEKINIFYRSKRPKPFEKRGTQGITFGHSIYTIYYPRTESHHSDFTHTTKHILHETTHSRQYRDLNWSLTRFGTRYMFEHCKAKFDYYQNVLEKSAYAKAGDKKAGDHSEIRQLLEESRGRIFFKFWAAENLQPKLGYPKSKTYGAALLGPGGSSELKFEKGVQQIKQDGSKWCFRTYTNAEVEARDGADCVVLTTPCRRKRSPPSGWTGPQCNQQARARHNAQCKKNKSEWEELGKRKFKCVSESSLPAFT